MGPWCPREYLSFETSLGIPWKPLPPKTPHGPSATGIKPSLLLGVRSGGRCGASAPRLPNSHRNCLFDVAIRQHRPSGPLRLRSTPITLPCAVFHRRMSGRSALHPRRRHPVLAPQLRLRPRQALAARPRQQNPEGLSSSAVLRSVDQWPLAKDFIRR